MRQPTGEKVSKLRLLTSDCRQSLRHLPWIRSLTNTPGDELDFTISGYFLLESLEDLPFAADSFHTVYGRKYADAEGQNMLSMNVEYLCGENDDYTLSALFRPGIPLLSLIAGAAGIIYGGILMIRNRLHKSD